MREFTPPQAEDLYELICAPTRTGSIITTSHRSPSDWYALFPNAVLAESALDRLVNSAHHVIFRGRTYRPLRRPDGGGKPPPTDDAGRYEAHMERSRRARAHRRAPRSPATARPRIPQDLPGMSPRRPRANHPARGGEARLRSLPIGAPGGPIPWPQVDPSVGRGWAYLVAADKRRPAGPRHHPLSTAARSTHSGARDGSAIAGAPMQRAGSSALRRSFYPHAISQPPCGGMCLERRAQRLSAVSRVAIVAVLPHRGAMVGSLESARGVDNSVWGLLWAPAEARASVRTSSAEVEMRRCRKSHGARMASAFA